MYPHLAEVVTEASFHEATGSRVEGQAGPAKRLMHDGRRRLALYLRRRSTQQALLAAVGALPIYSCGAAAGALTLQ